MPTPVTAYIATIVIFLAIDFVWLKYVALGFYREQIGHLMLDKPNLGIAAGFYLMYAVAVVVLAILPALKTNDWSTALIYGALLGMAAYGTYDITNLATLKNWPTLVSIVDWIWGTVLTGTVAMLAFFVTRSVSGN
jgi:uncharacterized membrane protein